MKRFGLALGLLLCAVGGAVGQGMSLSAVLQPVTSTVPSIDLNFLASTTALPPGVVFSRASSRSCTNSSGTIVTVTTNNPCLDYNPSTLAYIGLSVEAAATNLMFPSTNWLNSGAASGSADGITQNAAIAPDGTTTAMALIPGSFSHVPAFYNVFGGINATTYTWSVYAKQIGSTYPYLGVSLTNAGFGGGGTQGIIAGFNLSTCAFDSASTGGLAPVATRGFAVGNGWCRISVTGLSANSGGPWVYNLVPYKNAGGYGAANTGNNVDGAYVWGGNIETGYAPTSYIPTTTATATRAGDVAYLPVTGVRGVNGSVGSLFAQFIYEAPPPTPSYGRFIAFNDGNNPNAGTEIGFANSYSAYPSYVSSFIGNQASGIGGNTSFTISANSNVRAVLSFTPSLLISAVNADALVQVGVVPTYIAKTLTVLNLNQPQRFQGQASLWVQRVTFIPAFMGAAWVTGKANGSIP
jgi:hypothetical protein